MKIEGREDVAVSPADAWRGLNDASVLKACTPGLEQLEETTPGHFDAEIVLSLPVVTGHFKGTVDHLERVAPERLRLKFQGKGTPGFVNGEATLMLSPSEKGTLIHYEADVQVGGQIARLGQRMISGMAKEMAGQFFEAFEARAQGAAAAPGATGKPPPALVPAPGGLRAALQLLWRTLLNLLGLSKRA